MSRLLTEQPAAWLESVIGDLIEYSKQSILVKLRKHVTEALQQEGYQGLAPQLCSEWSRKDSPRYVYASTWSERHAAYAAGLGTFDLCDGLITPVGKAVRVESTHEKGRLVIRSVLHIVVVLLAIGSFQTPAAAKDQFRVLLAGQSAYLLASNSRPTVVRKKVYPQETTEDSGQGPAVVRKKVPPLPAAPEEQSTTQPAQTDVNETADEQARPASTSGKELSPTVGAEPGKAETVAPAVSHESTTQPEGPKSSLLATPPTEAATSPAQTTPQTGGSVVGATETSLPEPFPSHPYSLMLASCRTMENARKVVADHRNRGLSPFIVKVEFGKNQVWWRIMAGYYQSREEAAKAKEEYGLSDALIKKTPYTNLIGTFSSEENARDEVRRLEKLGYSPYPIRAEKSLRLLVGAFITREGAEKQKVELQSKGIASQIIER